MNVFHEDILKNPQQNIRKLTQKCIKEIIHYNQVVFISYMAGLPWWLRG